MPLISMSPLMALLIDAVGTITTQSGYIWMKFGQLSIEESQTGGSELLTRKGFFTFKWFFGTTVVGIGALVHFCK